MPGWGEKTATSNPEVTGHGLRTGLHMKFVIDMLDMCMHRAISKTQGLGGFLVTETFDEIIQHVHFARRKIFDRGSDSRSDTFKRLHDFARDVAGHRRTAAINVFYR